jgi:hypothetical protein
MRSKVSMDSDRQDAAKRAERISRVGIAAFLFLMIFEGAVRKWFFPGSGVILQVFRDVIPATTALAVFLTQPPSVVRERFRMPSNLRFILIAYIAIAVVLTYRSAAASILVPILGLRTHFAYVPLLILIPIAFGTLDALLLYVRKFAVIGIFVNLLAVYQTTQPASALVNVYASGEQADALFGRSSLVRSSGTFSYITGMGYFAQFGSVIFLALYLLRQTRLNKLLLGAAATAAAMGCLSTGARGVVFGTLIQLVIVFVATPRAARTFVLHLKRYAPLAVVLGIGGVYFAARQFEAFMERTKGATDIPERLRLAFFEWWPIVTANPIGEGTGSGHQQAAALVGGAGLGSGGGEAFGGLPEAELSRIAFELGFLGFAIFLLWRLAVLSFALKVVLRLKEDAQRITAAVSLSIIIILINSGMYSPVANAALYAAVAVILLIANTESSRPVT